MDRVDGRDQHVAHLVRARGAKEGLSGSEEAARAVGAPEGRADTRQAGRGHRRARGADRREPARCPGMQGGPRRVGGGARRPGVAGPWRAAHREIPVDDALARQRRHRRCDLLAHLRRCREGPRRGRGRGRVRCGAGARARRGGAGRRGRAQQPAGPMPPASKPRPHPTKPHHAPYKRPARARWPSSPSPRACSRKVASLRPSTDQAPPHARRPAPPRPNPSRPQFSPGTSRSSAGSGRTARGSCPSCRGARAPSRHTRCRRGRRPTWGRARGGWGAGMAVRARAGCAGGVGAASIGAGPRGAGAAAPLVWGVQPAQPARRQRARLPPARWRQLPLNQEARLSPSPQGWVTCRTAPGWGARSAPASYAPR
jgi:hypothetical protein